MDELRDRGFEMPSAQNATGCRVRRCGRRGESGEWFATRDERCRWNVVAVRAAGAEQTGPGCPGRFLFAGCRCWPRWRLTCTLLPRRRGRELGVGRRAAALAATPPCCAVGTASTSSVPWIEMEELRALDAAVRSAPSASRVARGGRSHIRAEGDLTAVAGPLGPFHLVHVARFLKREILAELASFLAPAASCSTTRSSRRPAAGATRRGAGRAPWRAFSRG